MNMTDEVTMRLTKAFQPSMLELRDDADFHKDHKGNESGGAHLTLFIAADCFNKMKRVEAHRKIYDVIKDLMPDKIHALQIQLKKIER